MFISLTDYCSCDLCCLYIAVDLKHLFFAPFWKICVFIKLVCPFILLFSFLLHEMLVWTTFYRLEWHAWFATFSMGWDSGHHLSGTRQLLKLSGCQRSEPPVNLLRRTGRCCVTPAVAKMATQWEKPRYGERGQPWHTPRFYVPWAELIIQLQQVMVFKQKYKSPTFLEGNTSISINPNLDKGRKRKMGIKR